MLIIAHSPPFIEIQNRSCPVPRNSSKRLRFPGKRIEIFRPDISLIPAHKEEPAAKLGRKFYLSCRRMQKFSTRWRTRLLAPSKCAEVNGDVERERGELPKCLFAPTIG